MNYELLCSEFKQIVAINCKVNGDILSVGYLFVELQTPSEIDIAASGGGIFRVKIPDDLAMQPTPKIALETELEVLQ